MLRPRRERRVRIGRVALGEKPVRVGIVTGPNPLVQAKRAKRIRAEIVEARIDLWNERDPSRAAALVRRVRRAAGRPVVATVRTKGAGGGWESKGRGERRRIEILRAVLKVADAIDIEYETRGRAALTRAARRAGVTVIFSHHEFRRALGARALEAIATRMRRAGADVVKLAPLCRARDSLVEALTFLGRTPNRPAALTPTGPWGDVGRVIAPIFGTALEYVPLGRPTAEGQVNARALDRARRALGRLPRR